MAGEISARSIETSSELPEDQQQQGLDSTELTNESNSTAKHYQTLLKEHQRGGSPQYQEILPYNTVTVRLYTHNTIGQF